MGTWGTYVVAKDGPSVKEILEEVSLLGGWHRFLVSEPLVVGPNEVEETVGRGPAILGTVADSDYCRVVGVADGGVRWVWNFGDAPWDPAPLEGESADPSSITSHAQDMGARIAVWAGQAGLTRVSANAIAGILDRGYDFAEEGLFFLLEAVGIAPSALDQPLPAVPLVSGAPIERRIHIWSGPKRWVLLQFNTTADLYDHLSEVASWLEQARQQVMVPLVASYEPALVRTSIGPHEAMQGAPGGLLVTSSGWSMKNRLVFGSGDDSGWTRKLRQLSRKELREINLRATAFGPSGHWHDGPGEIEMAAVLRDQFTPETSAPLPADHPGQLKVWAGTEMLARVPGFDVEAVLKRLGQLAVDTIPDGHAFVELERPLSGQQEVVPVSPVAWTSPLGAVEFRPESVIYSDPPRPTRS